LVLFVAVKKICRALLALVVLFTDIEKEDRHLHNRWRGGGYYPEGRHIVFDCKTRDNYTISNLRKKIFFLV
jgi:hypothetical protein